MTLSLTSRDRTPWKTLRAGLAFSTREADPAEARGAPRLHAVLAATAAVLAGLGLVAIIAGWGTMPPEGTDNAPRPAVAPEAAPAPKPAVWTEVVRPFEAYDLAGGPYAKLPLHYTARRNHADEARQDMLTYGDPTPGTAFLRLSFLRQGSAPAAPTSVFVDAARLAGGVGLSVTRSGLGIRLDTRFGAFEVARVTVGRRDATAACLAFRLDEPGSAAVLQLTGLGCGAAEHPITPGALACTIDKLDLVSAGDDEALRDLFVAAERRRRGPCSEAQLSDITLGTRPSGGLGHSLLKDTL